MIKEIKKMFNGNGEIELLHILDESMKNEKIRVYAQVTIPPLCSIRFHKHAGDSESYYVLSGEGIYQDNDVSYIIKKGDHAFCKDGCGHGVQNNTNEPLVLMALIIYTK